MSVSSSPRVSRLVVFILLALFALPLMAASAQDSTEDPGTEVSATETPGTEIPPSETPSTEIPTTEEPAEEPEYSWIQVAVVLCNDRACFDLGDRIGDMTITAIDIHTRESFGSCVTVKASETQGCDLEVPVDAQWTLSYDEDQTPNGYEYKGSLISVEGGAHGSITYLPFIPLADDAPAPPVAELPSTGATGSQIANTGTLATITLVLATFVLAGSALRLRRQ